MQNKAPIWRFALCGVQTSLSLLLLFTAGANAEVALCNSPTVEQTIIASEFDKNRDTLITQLEAVANSPPPSIPPFKCAPFVPPPPLTASGEVGGKYLPPFNRAYLIPQRDSRGQIVGQREVRPEEAKQVHDRICQAKADLYRRDKIATEESYKARQKEAIRQLNELANDSAHLKDIRQQALDSVNHIRICAAAIEYKSRKVGCQSVTYKIENLLDKPGTPYISWQCTAL